MAISINSVTDQSTTATASTQADRAWVYSWSTTPDVSRTAVGQRVSVLVYDTTGGSPNQLRTGRVIRVGQHGKHLVNSGPGEYHGMGAALVEFDDATPYESCRHVNRIAKRYLAPGEYGYD